ncbi:MAG: hypothetical protein QNJ51_06095 [Calothrix sp. MO_167.B12]|nr:hypothetical protein [Calothrix sp. MO_167.B12]
MTNASFLDKNKNHKSAKKKRQSLANMNIGSPLRPVRKRQHKVSHELLSDWSHAS